MKKMAGLAATAALVLGMMPFAAHAGNHNKEVGAGDAYVGVEAGQGCEGVYAGKDDTGYIAVANNGMNPPGYRQGAAGHHYHSNPVPDLQEDPDQSLCPAVDGGGIFP